MSEEDQIRRLLADARHTDPIPPDVAGRMDEVIADLGADRPVRSTVTDLAAVRRRRRVRTLLVAAAAVVVVGIGVDRLGGLDASDSDESAGGADSGAAAAPAETSGDAAGGPRLPTAPEDFASATPLHSGSFARQADRLRTARSVPGTTAGSSKHADGYTLLEAGGCRLPDLGRGRVVTVRYDGSPGVVVFRPARGDTQVADLFLCGHEDVVRSVTLPAK